MPLEISMILSEKRLRTARMDLAPAVNGCMSPAILTAGAFLVPPAGGALKQREAYWAATVGLLAPQSAAILPEARRGALRPGLISLAN